MQLTAKLIQVQPIQSGTGKNGEWKKQNIILETDGMYPKKVCIILWGAKIDEWKSLLEIGNMLDISFDIESREYNNNWFTDLRAWKVDAVGVQTNSIPPTANPSGATYGNAPTAAPTQAAPTDFSGDAGDDLPF